MEEVAFKCTAKLNNELEETCWLALSCNTMNAIWYGLTGTTRHHLASI